MLIIVIATLIGFAGGYYFAPLIKPNAKVTNYKPEVRNTNQ